MGGDERGDKGDAFLRQVGPCQHTGRERRRGRERQGGACELTWLVNRAVLCDDQNALQELSPGLGEGAIARPLAEDRVMVGFMYAKSYSPAASRRSNSGMSGAVRNWISRPAR